MTPEHGDGVDPDGFPPPGAHLDAIRIHVTLTPVDRTSEWLEIQHTPNVRAQDVADVLSTVAAILKADGPGVVSESGVIFGGIRRDG